MTYMWGREVAELVECWESGVPSFEIDGNIFRSDGNWFLMTSEGYVEPRESS